MSILNPYRGKVKDKRIKFGLRALFSVLLATWVSFMLVNTKIEDRASLYIVMNFDVANKIFAFIVYVATFKSLQVFMLTFARVLNERLYR